MNTSAPAAPSDSSWKVYAKAGGIYARSSNAEVGPFGSSGSGTSLNPGTSFPGSPSTNDLCFRTDRGLLYYYDGTRWLTVNEYTAMATLRDALWPLSANGNNGHMAVDLGDNGTWIMRIVCTTLALATNNGSHYWTTQFNTVTTAGSTATIGSSFNTSGDTASAEAKHVVTVGAAVPANTAGIYAAHTKTGSPGNYYMFPTAVVYRLIG